MSIRHIRGSHAAWYEQIKPGDWIRVTETRWGASTTTEGLITIPPRPKQDQPIIRALARDTTLSDTQRAQYAADIANGHTTQPTPLTPPTGTDYTDVPLFD